MTRVTGEVYLTLGSQREYGLRICKVLYLSFESALSDPVWEVGICDNDFALYWICAADFLILSNWSLDKYVESIV